jgi:oligosaccharide repeat unit polymerase
LTEKTHALFPRLNVLRKFNIAHPLLLFLGAWLITFLLFSLHLSEWLDFPQNEVTRAMAWICVPFALASMIFSIFYRLSPKIRSPFRNDVDNQDYLVRVERSMDRWFYCWIALTVIDVGFAGGLPMVWLLTGSSKTYTEFGLPVIHVFLTALLAVLAAGKLGLYLLYGNRWRLLIPAAQILWGILIVSRALIMGAVAQAVVLWLCLCGVTLKRVLRVFAASVLLVLIFGYMGDIRSGSDVFRQVARPTNNYPDWLPSGVLWFYIYITSPLANLVNTTEMSKPADDPLFSRTILFMFPNPLRAAMYGKQFSDDQQGAGDLVTPTLTVSSAYVGPYLDNGFWGIGCYSALLGVISAYWWRRRNTFRDELRYMIIGQCLLFSVFWNFLFYTPLLVQFVWIYIIFARRRVSLSGHTYTLQN